MLDLARSKGFRDGENPVTAIKRRGRSARGEEEGAASPGDAMARCACLLSQLESTQCLTCLTGSRTGEVLGMQWPEVDLDARIWICPAVRMKTGEDHRVPLTDEMLSIIEPLQAMQSDYVFEGKNAISRCPTCRC